MADISASMAPPANAGSGDDSRAGMTAMANGDGMHIEIDGNDPCVDARLVAKAFALSPEAVMASLRAGTITTLTERGTGEDAGRWRLSFFHGNCRLRLIVDEAGTILQHSRIDFGDTPLPPSMRRPTS